MGPPGVLGILGEWLFIFRELGSNANYFRGSREQAYNFGDLGSPAKKQKIKEKPPFCLIFLKILLRLAPHTPLLNAAFIPFRTSMLIYIYLREICAK